MEKCINIQQQEVNTQALQDTIYVIGGKWKLPIIYSICNGNKRFRDIERSIPGITTRMLSRNLRELEDNKLITRTVYPDSPVLVAYEFTEYAKAYGILINEMIEWGKKHRRVITAK
ncbi:winged helix-turn-helix transcriptional regulator [Parapedobacter koreensis]|uniref:Transcriptional regulator, HxlR family n=1 Tax=Parapedobacter koreensis TaxID=332977 RepID=A0A1H7LUH7_9SPHI|nr:helix-turn-helix domain-containing protein [Parapedobacter koreensis]SEL02519.1 transcriptional regulator, HxlR family [Parapedobacter koreensis]